MEKKITLEGFFTKFATTSYPGRIYGMYDWDENKKRWIINEKFCEEHDIKIKKSRKKPNK